MIKYRVYLNNGKGYTEFTYQLHAQQYAQSNNIPTEQIEEIEYELENENNSPLKIFNDFGISDPKIYDYDILGYHKERIKTEGELIQINYYRFFDFNTNVFSDKVIEEKRSFVRSETGLPVMRYLTIKWFREDNTVGCIIENRPKFYSSEESLEETETRRKNIITQVKKYIFENLFVNNLGDEILTLTQSKEILDIIGTQNIFEYINGNGEPLNLAVQNLNLQFVTQQMKANVLNILNYNYSEN